MGEDAGVDLSVAARLDAELWDPIARASMLRSSPRFDERVLDAAAGDGATALPTAELVGPGGIVDAIDPSEARIARLRERAGDRMPQLRTHVGDPTTWPYTGYDLVQCVLGVPAFADVEQGTEHLVQCARPGGRVVITVWAHGALEPLGEIVAAGPADGGDDDVTPPTRHHALTVAHAETAGTFAHWLTERGLVEVRAETVARHLEVTPDVAWDIAAATGLAEPSAGHDRFVADLEARDVSSIDVTVLIAVGHRPSDPDA
ncbi:class I SAM-dependent methyltransferase [Agromyces sp. NPDC056523]|uniref:class I SAM-dependent methyltransferase n=1 Tax=Agromyces sp. NPDC056523 TaxID=3345850 RepID=UPI00366E92A2